MFLVTELPPFVCIVIRSLSLTILLYNSNHLMQIREFRHRHKKGDRRRGPADPSQEGIAYEARLAACHPGSASHLHGHWLKPTTTVWLEKMQAPASQCQQYLLKRREDHQHASRCEILLTKEQKANLQEHAKERHAGLGGFLTPSEECSSCVRAVLQGCGAP